MADIKPLADIAEKYQRRASGAGADYVKGAVRAGPQKFEGNTLSASGTWADGVTQAIGRNAFAQGVSGSGAEWLEKINKLGQSRYTQGVGDAGPRFQRGFGPFAQVIQSVTLPAKFPRGDERNYERVRAIGSALHNARVRGS